MTHDNHNDYNNANLRRRRRGHNDNNNDDNNQPPQQPPPTTTNSNSHANTHAHSQNTHTCTASEPSGAQGCLGHLLLQQAVMAYQAAFSLVHGVLRGVPLRAQDAAIAARWGATDWEAMVD